MKSVGRRAAWLVMAAAMAGAMLAASGCVRSKAPESEPLPVAPSALGASGLELLWQTELLMDAGKAIDALWLCGDFLVARDTGNRLFAVNAKTGVRLWSEPMAAAQETVWPPAVDEKGTLWIPTTMRLVGIEGLDGRVVRRLELDFAPDGRPVTNGVHCFVPDARGWLQAVALLPKAPSWGRWTDDCVTAGPVLEGGLVCFGGQDGIVYASAQNVRRIVWQYQTEGPILGDLKRMPGGLVVAASLDYTLYAFEGQTGRLMWRYYASEPIRKSPYVFGEKPSGQPSEKSGGQVFVLTQGAGLAALNAADGRVQWRLAEGADVVTADEEAVYVLGRGGNLLAVGRQDGRVRFALPVRRGTLAAANESASGIVYLGTPEGRIVAVAKKKKEP
jgi:outer membrane protein assembly factor BamB